MPPIASTGRREWLTAREVATKLTSYKSRLRFYPYPEPFSISVRATSAEDGCWCFAGPEGRRANEPHEHNPGLGKCPLQPASADRWLVEES